MDINRSGFTSIEQVTGQFLSNPQVNNHRPSADISFDQVLKDKFITTEQAARGELKFSKHAAQRLQARNITLSDEQMKRLEQGAMRSEQKGIKESLVVMDDYAFIVNTTNNTVVTAMNKSNEGENIYTNIDGAVFV